MFLLLDDHQPTHQRFTSSTPLNHPYHSTDVPKACQSLINISTIATAMLTTPATIERNKDRAHTSEWGLNPACTVGL